MVAEDLPQSGESKGEFGHESEGDVSNIEGNLSELSTDQSAHSLPEGSTQGQSGNHSSANEEPSVEGNDITQAKTVIRGSSRVQQHSVHTQAGRGSPAAVAKVLLGQYLNHFYLEELIGGGGMGAVFRAHDNQLDRTVAIKVIPFVANDPDLQRRFRNEAQSAAKLDHPQIARVFDVGSQGDWHYIVFEYINGKNIRDLVAIQGVLSIDDAVFYTCQLSEALQHASDRGIVHRDIKPSNVLISDDEGIRLVDMGLARSASLDLSEDMTASGVTLGTFDYISPEQAKDPRDADLRSDLYSLGCTLYFMLTGSPPFPGGTMLQKLLSHGNTPPPNVQSNRSGVSDSLKAVIDKMLAKRPSDRYQTAHDLLADLKEVANRDGLNRSQSLNPNLVLQSRPWLLFMERNAPWFVALSLLLIVAGWLQLQSYAYRADIRVPEMSRQSAEGETLIPQSDRQLDLEDSVLESSGDSTTRDEISSALANEEANPGALINAEKTESFSESDGTASSDVEVEDRTSRVGGDNGSEVIDVPSAGTDEPSIDNGARNPSSFETMPSDDVTDGDLESVADINVIRVIGNTDDKGEFEGDGVITTSDLEAALRFANQYESTTRIELTVPLIVCDRPIVLESDDLLITSTIGGTTVVFQPQDSLAMARSKMFTIGSHSVVFEDLHFVWNVPANDLDGGCLFELNPNELVRFTDCSITVNNPALTDEVFAFDVITDLNGRRDPPQESEEKLPLVWVELNNAIVRGQMTMLRMDYATRLWLDWDNGLLSVTDRMIDTAGALYASEPGNGLIRMKFWRVTAHAPKGIFLMRVGVGGLYPVEIDRLAHECVFWVDSGVPHFDFRGFESITSSEPLKLQGASNTYLTNPERSDPMLRIISNSDDRKVVSMEDVASRAVTWAADKSPRWSVNWAFEGVERISFDQRSPPNYRQIDPNPLGFDEKALPNLPERGEFDGKAIQAALSIQTNR